MDHADHVRLIREGVAGAGSTWADLGCGDGAFTLALADLLGPGATINAVDRDAGSLARLRHRMTTRFPATELRIQQADFREPLTLPALAGIVMANSLHFVHDKAATLRLLCAHLQPGGRFVLVEYDADRGNPWVPHPLTFAAWACLADEAGLRDTRQIGSVPSHFLGSIYSALSLR